MHSPAIHLAYMISIFPLAYFHCLVSYAMSRELHRGLLTPRTLSAPPLKGQNPALVAVLVAAIGCQRPWIPLLPEPECSLEWRGELDDINVSMASKTDVWNKAHL